MNPQRKRFRFIMSLGLNPPLENNPVPEPA